MLVISLKVSFLFFSVISHIGGTNSNVVICLECTLSILSSLEKDQGHSFFLFGPTKVGK